MHSSWLLYHLFTVEYQVFAINTKINKTETDLLIFCLLSLRF